MHIYLHSVYCGFLDKHTSGIDVHGPVQAHVFASHYVRDHVIDRSGICISEGRARRNPECPISPVSPARVSLSKSECLGKSQRSHPPGWAYNPLGSFPSFDSFLNWMSRRSLRVPVEDAGARPVGGCSSCPWGPLTYRWDSAPCCSVCPVTEMTERSHHYPRSFPKSRTQRKTPDRRSAEKMFQKCDLRCCFLSYQLRYTSWFQTPHGYCRVNMCVIRATL